MNVRVSSLKSTRYSCHIEYNSNFLDRFWKNSKISDLMKICPVGAELFEVDGRMERHDEAGSRLSQFCEKRLYHCISPRIVFVSLMILTDRTLYLPRQRLIGVLVGRSLLAVR